MARPGPPPPKKREDWDVLGFPNRRIALNGPPAIQNFPSTGRGRGGPSLPPVRGRGLSSRGTAMTATSSMRPPPLAPRSMRATREWGAPAAGPSNYYEPRPQRRGYSPSNPVYDAPSSHRPPSPATFQSSPATFQSSPVPEHTIFNSSSSSSHTQEGNSTPVLPMPDTSVESEAKKMVFKPSRAGGSKGKAKVETRQDTKKDELDRKPNIDELEEETVDVQVDESERREGILAIMKDDIPKPCWSIDKSRRDNARIAFRKQQTEALRAEGRQLTSTMWRDDGVAYLWVKIAVPRNGIVSRTPPNVQNPSAALVSGTHPKPGTLPPENPSRASGASTERRLPNGEQGENVVEISWPPHLATEEIRQSKPDELKEFRVSQWAKAACVDSTGRSTRIVILRDSLAAMNIISRPIPPHSMGETVEERRRLVFKHGLGQESRAENSEISDIPRLSTRASGPSTRVTRNDELDETVFEVPWPPNLATKEMRTSKRDELKEFRQKHWENAASLDATGRQTRIVLLKDFPAIFRVISRPLPKGMRGEDIKSRRETLFEDGMDQQQSVGSSRPVASKSDILDPNPLLLQAEEPSSERAPDADEQDENVVIIPWPPHLSTKEMRVLRSDQRREWKLQCWAEASALNENGRATRLVTWKDNLTGLKLIFKALPGGQMGDTVDDRRQTMIRSEFHQQQNAASAEATRSAGKEIKAGSNLIPYPPQWTTKKSRHTEEYNRWVRRKIRKASMLDESGKPTRSAIPKATPSGLEIRWNTITKAPQTADEERFANGDHPPAEADPPKTIPLPRPDTPTSAQGSASASSAAVGKKRIRPETRPPVPSNGPPPPANATPASRTSSASNLNRLTPKPPATIPASSITTEQPSAKKPRANPPSAKTKPSHAPPTQAPVPPSQPERSSTHLRELEGAMQEKLTAIDNWTSILAEYPDRAQTVGVQVERMQSEIFRLRGAIRVEKERLSGAI